MLHVENSSLACETPVAELPLSTFDDFYAILINFEMPLSRKNNNVIFDISINQINSSYNIHMITA